MKKQNNLSLILRNRASNHGAFIIKNICKPICLILLQFGACYAIYTPNSAQAGSFGFGDKWQQPMNGIFQSAECGIVKSQRVTWSFELASDFGDSDGKRVSGVSTTLNPKNKNPDKAGSESSDDLPTRLFKEIVNSFILVPIFLLLGIWVGSLISDKIHNRRMRALMKP